MWLRDWYLDGVWCSVVQEKLENYFLSTRTSCATKFMSLLLYGQEKQELVTMNEHEAKAMVGASTKFSQCVHACMNQSVCRSCDIILLVFFLE